ncbi:Eukaryotic translation initiation factor 2 subunit alpha [Galdieria sulphuraria]|nr:Eukaryotic translation initiation factor 2 subunit alpha [Galdieria sulphuraria]
MYENTYPEPEDVVMVQVKDIQEMGAYVQLLEYNNIHGMIMLSELSRRRIRSVNKLLRVGRQEVCLVVRVDKEKGYIDLSKRRVTPEDLQRMEEKWNKIDLEDLYQRWGWPLYRRFGHAYDGFRQILVDPSISNDLEITEKEKEELMKNIQRKLTPTVMRFRADIEVYCFRFEGIDAVKEALLLGESEGTDESPVKVKLVKPPLYVVTTNCLDKTQGIDILQRAVEKIKTKILEKNGKFTMKEEPRAISDRDDRLLSRLMDELEERNREVSGDEESEEEIIIEEEVEEE